MTYTNGSATLTQSRTVQYLMSCMLIIALVMPSPVALFAQSQADNAVPAAGTIISVAGDVNALDPDGNSRELTRRDAVYVGDTIYTGATGFAQIRLADDGIVALRALTEFAIVDYQYEADPDTDISVFQLMEGGMRTVTGAIGEQNRARYRLNVGPTAYIGIRGTDYEAVITSSGVIATGVYDGGITFSNQVGSVDLGINADYDFAIMVDPNTAPQGLVAQPALLGLVQFIDVPDDDDNNIANGAAADGQANDGNGIPAAAAQIAGAADNAAAAGDQALIASATDNTASADSNQNGDSSAGFSAPTPALIDNVVTARGVVTTDAQSNDGDSSSVTVNPNEIAGDGAVLTPDGTVGNSLAAAGSSADTATDAINNSTGGDLDANVSATGAADTSTTVNTGNSTTQTTTNTGADTSVGNTLAATDTATSTSSSGTDAGLTGNGSTDTSVATASDNDSSAATETTTAVAGSAGDNSVDTNVSGNTNTDATDSTVTASVDVSATADADDTSASVDASVDTAATPDGNDDGTASTTDTTATADASADVSADGASASTDVAVDDTGAGADVAVADNGDVSVDVDLPGGDSTGDSSNDSSGDSNSDGSSDDDSDVPNVPAVPPVLLVRPETSISAYDVDWGKWGSSVDDNWVVVSNIDSELVQISTSDYFANVIPTEIAQMTGSHTYSTGIASSFLGSGSAGEVGSLSAAMHVNFDTGLISNGSLDVLVADQHWSVNFDGAISGGDVTLDALNGSLQQGSVYSSNNIDASLDGAFTGNQAEAFVGGFELLDLNNQNNFAEGLFTIER